MIGRIILFFFSYTARYQHLMEVLHWKYILQPEHTVFYFYAFGLLTRLLSNRMLS